MSFMKNTRYSYKRVLTIVFTVYLCLNFLGMIAAYFSGSIESHYSPKNFFTWRNILCQVYFIIFVSGIYYVLGNIFYRLIATRKGTFEYVKVAILGLIPFAIFYTGYYFISDQKLSMEVTTKLLIFSCAISSLFQLGLSILIPYLIYLRDEKNQRKILEEEKLQLEVEKSQANFNFLKAQINPHFLHNTLNFLYAKALPLSSELSEGILTLSDIMRYALSEGNARDGRAPLKDEIEHVQNVIKIQQLRFENKLNVHFEVKGSMDGATIIPFVLITLVENAFKHGDLKNTEHPIDIRVEVKNRQLYFYCRNKKKMGPKELSTGIGLVVDPKRFRNGV